MRYSGSALTVRSTVSRTMTQTISTVPRMIDGSFSRSTADIAMSDGWNATASPRRERPRGQDQPGEAVDERGGQRRHRAVHHLQPEQIGVQITRRGGEEVVVRDVVAAEVDDRQRVEVEGDGRQPRALLVVGRGVGPEKRPPFAKPEAGAERDGDHADEHRPDEHVQAGQTMSGILGPGDRCGTRARQDRHDQVGRIDPGQELREEQRGGKADRARPQPPGRSTGGVGRPTVRLGGRIAKRNPGRRRYAVRRQRRLRRFRRNWGHRWVAHR